MTAEQINVLLQLLGKIADKPFAITQATDWPILLVLGGVASGLLCWIWRDLKQTIRDGREEWRDALRRHKEENDKAIDTLWLAHKECQADCCPRRKE